MKQGAPQHVGMRTPASLHTTLQPQPLLSNPLDVAIAEHARPALGANARQRPLDVKHFLEHVRMLHCDLQPRRSNRATEGKSARAKLPPCGRSDAPDTAPRDAGKQSELRTCIGITKHKANYPANQPTHQHTSPAINPPWAYQNSR